MNNKSIMDQFFINRDDLIDRYGHGNISKTEFVEENYAFIMSLELQPFTDDLDERKCIYNYQYYNILAKYANLKAQEVEIFNPKEAEALKIEEFGYYDLKDEATLALLEYVNYKHVKAYFLNLSSRRLEGQLYEIVFEDIRRAIFHSMSPKILKKLRENGVFSPVYKESVIHGYVNSGY